DSRVVQRLYTARFRRPSTYIPYGAELPPPTGDDYLARYGLQQRGYILMVGRLVPENGVHVLLEAYAHLGTQMPLVIVGDAPYADEYVTPLHARANLLFILTSWLSGERSRQPL